MTEPTASGAGKRDAKVGCGLSARFALVGATLGVLLGFCEAAILYTTRRAGTMVMPDVRPVVWFLAPLLGSLLFSLLGWALGAAAGRLKDPTGWRAALVAAAGLGAAGAYLPVVWELLQVASLREALASEQLVRLGAWPLASFSLSAVAAVLVFKRTWTRTKHFFDADLAWPHQPLSRALLAALLVLCAGLASDLIWQPTARSAARPVSVKPDQRPNVVLVVLDTVRADHLSAYGYERHTTPHVDEMAMRGVLFENAVSTTSWSLPSHVSLQTGLLPHQHASHTSAVRNSGIRMLAEILSSWGYETAGFNANQAYGHASWGFGRGFEVYVDDTSTLRYNLARTLLGRSLGGILFQLLVRPDRYDRRDAREVNREVLRWWRHRAGRPFFLFVTYFDAHNRYLAPKPFDQRFGKVSVPVIRRVNSLMGSRIPEPLPAEDQQSLIAGYDNCLAFLDHHLGELFRLVAGSPEAARTIFVVTSDHGEAFGEHGFYDHGTDLYRESIHIPLLITGAGVPAGVRIPHAVSNRQVFATVLDLASQGHSKFRDSSLRRYWTPDFNPEAYDDEAVSQLLAVTDESGPVAIMSLTTSQWHYLVNAKGTEELYDWPSDPIEAANLASLPEHETTVKNLNDRLHERIAGSTRPWRFPDYLGALDRTGYSFLRDVALRGDPSGQAGPARRRVGKAQAFFSTPATAPPARPSKAEEELLRNLPYR